MISIDTPNEELLKKIRPGTRLNNVAYNIARIKAKSYSIGLPSPVMSANCTITAPVLKTLQELVCLVKALGIAELHLTDVTELSGLRVRYQSILHFREYSKEECSLAIAQAKAKGVELDVRVSIDKGLEESLEGTRKNWLQNGETRVCLDPWRLILVKPNGDIHTCCIDYPPIAHISDVSSIHDIFFSPANLRCKEELLSGRLHVACRKCARKAPGLPDELDFQVRSLLVQQGATTPA